MDKVKVHIVQTSLAAGLLFVMQPTSAQQVFFGEDINWTATGQNEDSIRIIHPNADLARSMFISKIINPVTETFETSTPNSSVSTLTFGTNTNIASLSPALSVIGLPTGTFNGTYPISGNNFLLHSALGTNTFSITFSSPQVAFGFYVTDIEVRGNLSVRFLLADGVTIVDRPVPSQVNALPGDNNTGSVAFWGIVDADNPFTRVTFVRNLNVDDGFGFDDITIAQIVPEPSNYALMLLGFATVLTAIRRKRSQYRGSCAE
jgi:hypothetical protein